MLACQAYHNPRPLSALCTGLSQPSAFRWSLCCNKSYIILCCHAINIRFVSCLAMFYHLIYIMLILNKQPEVADGLFFLYSLFYASSNQVFSTFVGDLKEDAHYWLHHWMKMMIGLRYCRYTNSTIQ